MQKEFGKLQVFNWWERKFGRAQAPVIIMILTVVIFLMAHIITYILMELIWKELSRDFNNFEKIKFFVLLKTVFYKKRFFLFKQFDNHE